MRKKLPISLQRAVNDESRFTVKSSFINNTPYSHAILAIEIFFLNFISFFSLPWDPVLLLDGLGVCIYSVVFNCILIICSYLSLVLRKKNVSGWQTPWVKYVFHQKIIVVIASWMEKRRSIWWQWNNKHYWNIKYVIKDTHTCIAIKRLKTLKGILFTRFVTYMLFSSIIHSLIPLPNIIKKNRFSIQQTGIGFYYSGIKLGFKLFLKYKCC